MRSWCIPASSAFTVLCTMASQAVYAQARPSEQATVSQTSNGTTITVEYSRPVARGRNLFGGLVRWEEVWTPGANWATTLEADRDVRVEGHALPRGKYSVWMIPREQAAWTVFLCEPARVFHTQRPRPEDAKVSFTVRPREAPHVDVLTWWFPEVSAQGAVLHMQWGTTAVPLTVAVEGGRGGESR